MLYTVFRSLSRGVTWREVQEEEEKTKCRLLKNIPEKIKKKGGNFSDEVLKSFFFLLFFGAWRAPTKTLDKSYFIIFFFFFFPPSLVSDLPDVLFFFYLFIFFFLCSFRHYLRNRNPAVWPHFDKSKGSYLNEHICQWVLSLCREKKKRSSAVWADRPPLFLPSTYLVVRQIFLFQLGFF